MGVAEEIALSLQPLLLFVHVAAVVVWVGGMFFAYLCLRPVAAELLEPPTRLRLWRRVLARFFSWVWGSVVFIIASGLTLFAAVGFAAAPLPWHLMLLLGVVMTAIFTYVYFGPYRFLQTSVDSEDWSAGSAALARIRRFVGINLLLGISTIAMATLSRVVV
jgi:uncharacterized membrane protein